MSLLEEESELKCQEVNATEKKFNEQEFYDEKLEKRVEEFEEELRKNLGIYLAESKKKS
jgi:hypothetical protein